MVQKGKEASRKDLKTKVLKGRNIILKRLSDIRHEKEDEPYT